MRQVQREFGFKAQTWNLLKHIAQSSLVARIIAKDGKSYLLKSLFIPEERQHFIVKSEQLLAQEGVKLARPISTVNGDPFMIYNQMPYVLYEWIDGKPGVLRNRSAFTALIQVMARFHKRSSRVVYPDDVTVYGHLHWEKEYRERIHSMKRWSLANASPKSPQKHMLRHFLPFFEEMAERALKELMKSDYENYINGHVAAKSLIHGDYHQKNLINRKGEWILIDFEDVRYDFPSKDMLRLYGMYTRRHPFDAKTFNGMMEAYYSKHPLPAGAKHLMLTDFLFPHIVERTLRKKDYVHMSPEMLEHRLQQEKRKAMYVSSILSDKQRH